jgi:hypothetical protein
VIWILIVALVVGLLLLAVVGQPTGRRLRTKKRSSGRRSNRVGSLDREFVARKWATIQAMSQGNGGSLRDAVSEADKLLDYALKNTSVRGETMGERLKNSGGRFSDINAIWSAHKVRNALAHEAEFDLVPAQAQEAINSLERGLRDLGAL